MAINRCPHPKKLHRTEAVREGGDPDDVIEVCGQAFATLGQLTKHGKQVHGVGPEGKGSRYPCNGCLRQFNTKQCLRDHQKKHNCFDLQVRCYMSKLANWWSLLGEGPSCLCCAAASIV